MVLPQLTLQCRFHFEQEVRPIVMGLYSHMAAQCMLLADVVDDKLQLAQVQ